MQFLSLIHLYVYKLFTRNLIEKLQIYFIFYCETEMILINSCLELMYRGLSAVKGTYMTAVASATRRIQMKEMKF